VEANQLLGLQGGHGIGASFIVTELDLGHGGGKQFNDGSNLTAYKSFIGHIVEYSDFGEKLHLTHTSSSYRI
jgi:hypothetical protein